MEAYLRGSIDLEYGENYGEQNSKQTFLPPGTLS